jgi:glycosyltransferase involved in cell wall biosynthesis
LIEAGWRVVVAGYDGHSPRPADWIYLRLESRAPRRTVAEWLAHFALRQAGRALYLLARWHPGLAQLGARLYYNGLANWRRSEADILDFAAEHPELVPSLVIAHDYNTCPPAAELARRACAPFVVDCHEYARKQFPHNPLWMADQRHFVTAFQDDYLARADAVTTVCDSIGRLLDREQRLNMPTVTVRSLPFYQQMPLRPAVEPGIQVLYHGIIARGRGLEQVIRSVPLWRPEYRLTIRGNGKPAYVDRLRSLAAAIAPAGRIRFEPAVSFDRIIPEANQADIGIFVQGDLSPQKRFALPNKFFEYIMAGLALCVSDLPEMAAVLKQYDLGVLVPEAQPGAIAEAINSLTRERILAFKTHSLAAAAELNWEREQHVMLNLFNGLVAERARLRGRGAVEDAR